MNSRNKRRVLLLFPRRSERTDGILDGLAGYTRPRVQWSLCVNEQASTEQSHQSLSEHQWSDVISDGTTNSLVEACSRLNVPLIDITDGAKFSNVPKIRPNNFGIGQLAARDLKERGFEHFAFCGYSTELWSCERRDGFVEALALMGRPSKLLESAYDPRCPPGWDLAQVPEIAAFLKKFSRPTALMACNDQRAAQVLAAANELGISVPNELAVLGVNNDQARCAFIQPALSSIALNAYQTGYLAAKTLDQCIHGDRSAGLLDIRVDPTGVVTRQSTEIFAADTELSKALRFIRENACRGLTVKEVVCRVAVSRDRLEKRFRRLIGHSPQAEIRRIQLARIKDLLIKTELPLSAIAQQTGFRYVEYLAVFFKRIVGHTPGHFRKTARLKCRPRVARQREYQMQ